MTWNTDRARTLMVGTLVALAAPLIAQAAASSWMGINSTGQIAAPIFYDSSNAAYYLQPSSNSKFSQVTAEKFCIGASCITSWPSGGVGTLDSVTDNGNTTTNNITVNDVYDTVRGSWVSTIGKGAQFTVQASNNAIACPTGSFMYGFYDVPDSAATAECQYMN